MSRVTAASPKFAPLLLAIALASCSAAGTNSVESVPQPQPQAVAVAVTPDAVQVQVGKTQAFQAVVTGSADTSVSWAVAEGTAGGNVSTVGFYTAPGTAGTYHVVATSNADASKSATATLTVTAAPPPTPVTVAITPAAPAVDACKSVTFSAAVTGSTNTGVTWAVQEGVTGGSISAQGVYSAPSTDGTYHVVATSKADTSVSKVVPVVVANRVLSVVVNPANITVPSGGSTQFAATVTTTCGSVTALRSVNSAGVVTAN
jgi:hypothetical protein